MFWAVGADSVPVVAFTVAASVQDVRLELPLPHVDGPR